MGHNDFLSMEEPLSDNELRELHRITQEAALKAYPNPDRTGCPGSDTLREVAASSWPADHEAYNHIKECSPCLGEMLEFGKALDREKRRRRLYRIWAIAAGLLVCFGITFQTWRIHIASTSSDGSQVAIIDRTINLWDRDTLRGGGQPVPLEAVSLPANRVRVRVILPRLSEGGKYTIAVTEDKYGRNVLAKNVGSALVDGSREVVTVILDLRRATSGAYFLQTTRDQDEASYYYPLDVH